MKYRMEFYHTTLDYMEKALRKRYLADVPTEFSVPLTFQTPLLFRSEDYSSDPTSITTHKLKIEVSRDEPFLVLNASVSIFLLNLIFGLLLMVSLIFSHIVLGSWLWIFLFAFSFSLFYWQYNQRLTIRFENYCEKLKKEIIE